MTRQRPAYEVSPGVAIGMCGGVPRVAFLESDGGWKGATRDPQRGLLINRDAEPVRNDRLVLGQPSTLFVAIYLALAAIRHPPNWDEVIRAIGVTEALTIAVGVRPDEMEPVHQFFGKLPRRKLVGALTHKEPRVREAAMMALGSATQP